MRVAFFVSPCAGTRGSNRDPVHAHLGEVFEALADRIVALRAGQIVYDTPGSELQRVYAEIFELEAA